MPGRIILLNGPSSSGKSTLAKALQALIREKRNEMYGIVSIDDFMKIAEDETIYEDDVFEISGDMCAKAIDEMRTAPGVIIDHVITSRRIFDQLREMLGAYALYLVRVTCPHEELLRREAERGNRCPGSAEASEKYLYPQEGYDLTVNTFAASPEACAAVIADALFAGPGKALYGA
ncbi:MAG: AAA family ATPase [Clostridia bacterium]|nr:AAA family ATPase [Clostridia bacterium]